MYSFKSYILDKYFALDCSGYMKMLHHHQWQNYHGHQHSCYNVKKESWKCSTIKMITIITSCLHFNLITTLLTYLCHRWRWRPCICFHPLDSKATVLIEYMSIIFFQHTDNVAGPVTCTVDTLQVATRPWDVTDPITVCMTASSSPFLHLSVCSLRMWWHYLSCVLTPNRKVKFEKTVVKILSVGLLVFTEKCWL